MQAGKGAGAPAEVPGDPGAAEQGRPGIPGQLRPERGGVPAGDAVPAEDVAPAEDVVPAQAATGPAPVPAEVAEAAKVPEAAEVPEGRGQATGPAPRPPTPRRPLPRRAALLAGGAVLAGAWTSGCTGDDAKSSGAPAASGPAAGRTTAAGGTSRPQSPAGTRSASAADWSALGSGLDGDLVRPQDRAYAVDHRLYNTRYDGLRPSGIAYVTGAGDIRACLDFARRTGTPVAIRSGGHSYAGWSSGDRKLIVDVSRMNAISMDSDGSTATIGAGAKLIDVYRTLGGHGRTIPGGSCPSVGISGLTLGGGHGVVSRSMGLTCDNLTGATLVTADGRTHEVSADAEPDVFWALRGAGNGNFGVVTSLRFATHPLPAGVVTGYLTWPWSKAAAVVAAWQSWGPDQPDHIWSALHLDCSPGATPNLSVAMLSTGSKADLASAADTLATSARASASSVSLHPHDYLSAMFDYAGCENLSTAQCHLAPAGSLGRETYTARSDFYDTHLPAAGIDALLAQVSRLSSRPGGGEGAGTGSVALTALGGAVNRPSPTATAFPHRRSRVLAQYIASNALSTTSWLDTSYAALRRWASGGAYANYTDPRLTDWRTAYYGPNATRLSALKSHLDPTGLFTFPQAL